MPLYEYRCEACGAKEEKLQSFSAPVDHDCPVCARAGGMHREISRTAFVLSGSGWYANGYGPGGESGTKEAKAGTAPAESTAGAAPAPTPSTPSEAAPETKAACATGCACHSPRVQAATQDV